MRRMSSSHVPNMKRRTAPALPFSGPAAGLLLEDHRVEHLLDDLLGLRVEAGDGFELELEVLIRPALVLGSKSSSALTPSATARLRMTSSVGCDVPAS